MKRLAILITSYNRKKTTLSFLENLSLIKPKNSEIFLVDDGSTDGTYEEVKMKFPNIYLIKGNGNLFWNRGMFLAWETASNYYDYDGFIWINDDSELYDDAFEELLRCASITKHYSIICGAFEDRNINIASYSGKDNNNNSIIPNGKLQEVIYLNGNLVYVPRFVFEKVGTLDPIFHHHKGDYDYGLRARKLGIKTYSTTKFVGNSQQNPILKFRARKRGSSLFQRLKCLYSPLGSNPKKEFIFSYRHFGLIKACLVFLKLHIINFIPDILFFRLQKIKDKSFYFKYGKKN